MPLLPTNLTSEEYAEIYLKEFGTGANQVATWIDPTGEELHLSVAGLFKDAKGHWKFPKDNRGIYLLYLAEVIKAPAQIWLNLETLRSGGKTRRRRYWKHFTPPNRKPLLGVAVFEYGNGNWQGRTTFVASPSDARRQSKYLKQNIQLGKLVWSPH